MSTDAKRIANESIKVNRDTIKKIQDGLKKLKQSVTEIIAGEVKDDDTISNSRITYISNEVTKLVDQYTDEVEKEIEEGVSTTTKVVGGLVVALLLGGSGKVGRYSTDDILRTRWNDGMTLYNRTQVYGGTMSDRLRTVIRSGVYRNRNSMEIINGVLEAIDGEQWKSDTLVQSEIMNAMRLQIGKTLEENGDAYIQLIESQLCTSRNHESHMCHILAHEDRYGKGMGVFKVTDMEIYHPHPRCRSFLTRYEGE